MQMPKYIYVQGAFNSNCELIPYEIYMMLYVHALRRETCMSFSHSHAVHADSHAHSRKILSANDLTIKVLFEKNEDIG